MITAPTQFSGLQVWLDASDTTTLFQLSGGTTAVAANNDPVGYWGDKSGNARHFTNINGSATTRPTWVSSLSTVRFDGSNDYLTFIGNQTYAAQTVFVATRPLAFASLKRIFSQHVSGTVDNGNYVPLVQASPGTTGAVTSWGLSNEASRSQVSFRVLSGCDILTSWHSGTNINNFVNGSPGGLSPHTLGTITVARQRLGNMLPADGGASAFTNYYTGDISEVIVYNRALTNVERADVEYYLTRKWNFLNSIPRQVYGIKNGLWSLTDTWSVSAEPSPWNFPLSADNAYTNTFTITADSSTRVDTIRNSTLAPNISAGGSFWLANGVSLSASANATGGNNFALLRTIPSASAVFVGNITGSADTSTAGFAPGFNSFTEIYGIVTGSGGGVGVECREISGSNTFVYGTVQGGTSSGIRIGRYTTSVGPSMYLRVIGTVQPGGGTGINVADAGICEVFGRVLGGTNTNGRGILCTNGTLRVYGDVIASTGSNNRPIVRGASAFAYPTLITLSGNFIAHPTNPAYDNISPDATSDNFRLPLTAYGNIINAPNGRQALYEPRIQYFSSSSPTYTRHAVNGYDSYVDYWTSNATFTYPASSDVALGTTYSNNTLSGSMVLPSPSSVAFGALVGSTTGTATPLTIEGILNQPLSGLATSNSIGARLKNITTSQALSAIVDSLEF